ncbi:monovalent cation/H+ antiporter complex subunit F [Thermococcus barophilus]|uniref:Membrane bound subgroup 4b [NiFe]-hydrogenase MBH(B)1, subunit Mbh(B)1B n=1 Tax=Thermococcus barophilus TaxID=55802 RepID=A0A0S1X9Z8_THEBA|nr:monovalent cation/H+ antiporter complex subunit F [Thermococcus barophilus]ALM74611.1 Membrane bound subgroup 4b [NiFe]-hydrogenase MBH(b)1, subunit Mbh(b)1B [Thermococcus barophilus]
MIDTALYVLIFAYAFTGMVYFARVLMGPTILDSVLAADCLSLDIALIVLLISLIYGSDLLATGAFFLVLWVFVMDVFVAKYLVRKEVGV